MEDYWRMKLLYPVWRLSLWQVCRMIDHRCQILTVIATPLSFTSVFRASESPSISTSITTNKAEK